MLEKLKNTKILAMIGVAGLFLGTIMPYVKISLFGYSQSLVLFDYWEGKVILFLAIANLLFIFKDVVEKYVPAMLNSGLGRTIANLNNPKLSLIPTILSVVFMIYLHSSLDVSSDYASYGLGFYLLWIGAMSLVAYAVLYKNNCEAATNNTNINSGGY